MGDKALEELKREVEALLFLYAKELTPKRIAKLLNKREEDVRKAVEQLMEEYKQRDSSLVVRKAGKSYSLTVKQAYAERLREIIKRKELSNKALKVLALIKKYNGILKSKLSKALGSWVYEAIAELKEKGFVKEYKVGRSSRLSLTEKFKEYFES